MESNNTEEILCSNCGRPNLQEAIKCWYCQTPLNKEASESEAGQEQIESLTEEPQNEEPQAENQDVNSEENIPEWLKRVRELKQQDYPEEDEVDEWQQQVLFDNSSKEDAKQARKKRAAGRSKSKHKQPADSKKTEQPKAKPALDIKKNKAIKDNQPEISVEKETEKEKQSEDLPDGFIKLNPKND